MRTYGKILATPLENHFSIYFQTKLPDFLVHVKLPEFKYLPLTTDFVSAATISKKTGAFFTSTNHIARFERCVLPHSFRLHFPFLFPVMITLQVNLFISTL